MARKRVRGGGGEDGDVLLPAELRMSEAQALKTQLLAALAADGALCLDAGAVSATDTSGLQLLLAAVRSARARGCEVRWRAVSPVLVRDAQQIGIAAELELP